MDKKLYSIFELKKHHRVYNELIEFLKKTITTEDCKLAVDDFESEITGVDDKIKGAESCFGICLGGALGMIASSMAFDNDALLSNAGFLGGLAALRYILCLMTLREGVNKKSDYLKYLKAKSESENEIKFPFEVNGDLMSAENYAKKISEMEDEQLKAFIAYLRSNNNEMSK